MARRTLISTDGAGEAIALAQVVLVESPASGRVEVLYGRELLEQVAASGSDPDVFVLIFYCDPSPEDLAALRAEVLRVKGRPAA